MFLRPSLMVNGLLVFFLSLISLSAVTQVTCVPVFTNEYNSGDKIEPAAIRSLPDGNLLVAGRGTSNPGDPYDGMVMKLSANGAIIWSFRIGGTADDAFTGLTELNDGSFLLFGVTASYGYPEGKSWLVHIDAMGTLLWSRQLGSATVGADRMKAVKQFADGDLIGTMNINDSSAASDPVVFKIGLNGTLRWAQRFDNGDNDSFTSLVIDRNYGLRCRHFYTDTHQLPRGGA